MNIPRCYAGDTQASIGVIPLDTRVIHGLPRQWGALLAGHCCAYRKVGEHGRIFHPPLKNVLYQECSMVF